MHKRWWIVGGLAVALIAVGGWGYWQAQRYQQLQTRVETEYQRSFYTLVSHVENLDSRLVKAQAAGSSMQTTMNLSEVWRHAYGAQEALSRLPVSHFSLTRTEKFLNQVADFCYVLARKNAAGLELDEKDIRQLSELQEQCTLLSGELHQMEQQLAAEQMTWNRIAQTVSQGMRNVQGGVSLPIVDGFNSLEKQMMDYPALIYDGPFSEHIRREPRALPEQKISPEQARQIAQDFINDGVNYNIEVSENQNTAGLVPSYSIQMTPTQNGARVSMDISKQGGLVVWMIKDRASAGNDISIEKAQEIGEQYLAERDFPDMEITSGLIYGNVAVLSYVGTKDDILLYPDLIKVKIALDNGDVIGYEALSYIMSHTERDLPEPEINMEDARARVNNRLFVDRERLALIPLETMDEVLCYEFRGRMNGEEFLVYINTQTGNEEKILRLVRTPQGVVGI